MVYAVNSEEMTTLSTDVAIWPCRFKERSAAPHRCQDVFSNSISIFSAGNSNGPSRLQSHSLEAHILAYYSKQMQHTPRARASPKEILTKTMSKSMQDSQWTINIRSAKPLNVTSLEPPICSSTNLPSILSCTNPKFQNLQQERETFMISSHKSFKHPANALRKCKLPYATHA